MSDSPEPSLSARTARPGITFDVDNVKRATNPLREVRYPEAIDGMLGTAHNPDARPVESCHRYFEKLVDGVSGHPVVEMLTRAYADHRPISLSPDAIWLLITQGVANHINANAETLRGSLVRHSGRLTLTVNLEGFVKGAPENPWPTVFGRFSEMIAEHIGPMRDLFIPSFSTTGAVEKAAAEIVLCDATKQYFEYRGMSFICGIPAVTVEGTPGDWRSIIARLDGFESLGLEWWFKRLRPVLEEFAHAADGDVDQTFWQFIYKIQSHGVCFPSGVTGWINVFFPYLKDQRGLPAKCNPWLSVDGYNDTILSGRIQRDGTTVFRRLAPNSQQTWGMSYVGCYPLGLSVAPFVWGECLPSGVLVREWKMEFLGGFVGIRQNTDTLTLRPEIGWAVRDAE